MRVFHFENILTMFSVQSPNEHVNVNVQFDSRAKRRKQSGPGPRMT